MNKVTGIYVDSLFKKNTRGGNIFISSDSVDAEFCFHFLLREKNRMNLEKEKEDEKNPFIFNLTGGNSSLTPIGGRNFIEESDQIDSKIKAVKKGFKKNALGIPKPVSDVVWEGIQSKYDDRVMKKIENH